MAQNHMKQQVDQGHSECQFIEGDQVFLRLQPYKQTSLKDDHCQKLEPKFYGPYIVLKCVGHLAYQLVFKDKFMSADTDQSPQIHLDLEQNVTEYYSFPRSSY